MPESTRYAHLDRVFHTDLGEWEEAAHALDDWVMRRFGRESTHHGLGLLLDLLADAGYTVTPPAKPTDDHPMEA